MTRDSASFAPAHLVREMQLGVAQAEAAKAALQTAGDARYSGRFIEHDGEPVLNFVCCSYLGLEQRAELRHAAIDAINRFGTQFSCSRAVIQSPLYEELEERLAEISGGHVLVAPSTTLAHVAALPVLIEPGEAVLIDQFAHASLHTAIALLRGVRIELLRHGRMDLLEARIRQLSATYDRVWYVCDGLYSMSGVLAPIEELQTLLDAYPSLRLYVDDAHSTSWTGTHGRGHALERLRDRGRVAVVLSLNKAFSAGGAALVLPTAQDVALVRRSGGPLVFGGPLQPPLLGAAVASAKLHLGQELPTLQTALRRRLALTVALARECGVPLVDETLSPIFFVRCVTPEKTFALVQALRERKMMVMPAFFPIVPHHQAGIRFTISLHNTPDDIRALMSALSTELDRLEIEQSRRQSSSLTLRAYDDGSDDGSTRRIKLG
jgi:7-keto-8-aminopelargonate synthetase-like enzyme